jgi:DNA-binding NtrC family response regulator
MSKSKFKILYGECEPQVLASQAAEMEKAGYAVQTAEGRKGVEEAMRRESFDLVVLGPTLTRNDRHHLPYMVKKFQQGTRVLVMHTDGERHPLVDANIDTGEDMQHLLAKIAATMGVSMAKAAGAGK